jgi:DNA (cytosine-5)-methyltransferase 1
VVRLKVLDLFCGVGGLAYGFGKLGFDVTGVDVSESVGRAFQLNTHSRFIKADLSSVLIPRGGYDVLIGGPPCRPWSAVNTTKRGKDHADHRLLARFFRHVEYHFPKIFLLENVPLIESDDILRLYIKRLSRRGYSVLGDKVKYSDYGAPTSRHRYILFGTRKGDAAIFFSKLLDYTRTPKTVRDAIWRLRHKKKGAVPDHEWPELKTIRKYEHYYKSGKFGWYILKWGEPAPSFGNVMKTYILHPDSFNGGSLRVISVREALLIMGFDGDFSFPQGLGLGLRYQMAVDAVSPVFSYTAATVMKDCF